MINFGLAKIRVERDREQSTVVDEFSQAPLQLHRPLYLDDKTFPTVYLKTPSSGLLGGDRHELEVEVGADSQLELRTQAATLVYPGHSTLTIDINVKNGAKLTFLPHALILGAKSSLAQKVTIQLEPEATLEYSDSWCAGRIAMNELWQFDCFDYRLEVFRADELIYRENWTLKPIFGRLQHPLICGDFTHFSTLFAFGKLADCDVVSTALPDNEWETDQTWKLVRDGDHIIKRCARSKIALSLSSKRATKAVEL